MRNYCLNQKGFAPILIILGLVILGGVIGGTYYLGKRSVSVTVPQSSDRNLPTLNQNLGENPKIEPENTSTFISAYELIKKTRSNNENDQPNNPSPVPSAENTQQLTTVNLPQTYGFTKLQDLKFIGIKALFPENAEVSLTGDQSYAVRFGDDIITLTLNDYISGGRRAWFSKEYPGFTDTFEPFYGRYSNGYITYLQSPDSTIVNPPIYYFSSIRPKKMLLVNGSSIKYGHVFFNRDLNKFKSLISGIELTNAIDPNLYSLKTADYLRWSENRRNIWEDYTLGLRITISDWVEYRNTIGRNTDGTYNFTDWQKVYPEAKTYSDGEHKVVSVQYGYYSDFVSVFIAKYQNKEFNDVVYDLLLPAGFCTTEWKTSKADCGSSDFCYTRDDVVNNLKLLKEVSIGQLKAQLRGLDPNFDYKNDCRASDTWLIKARNGQFVTTNIYPDADIVKIEYIQ